MTTENKRDYNMATNLWCRGIDWYVFKVGNMWRLADCFGTFPLYKTKKEAAEVARRFVLNNTK